MEPTQAEIEVQFVCPVVDVNGNRIYIDIGGSCCVQLYVKEGSPLPKIGTFATVKINVPTG